MPGQTHVVNYTVKVDRTSVDSNFAVAGTITLTNIWPKAASIVSVSDSITGAQVDCHGATTIAAQGSVTCDYTAALDAKVDGTNTATASVNYGAGARTASGSVGYTFGHPTTLADDCVTVTDPGRRRSRPDPGHHLRAEDVHVHTRRRPVRVGRHVLGAQRGELRHRRHRHHWQRRAHRDHRRPAGVAGVHADPGYWKTHSKVGPAPYDNNWANLSALEQNTAFYSSGATWYQVFWTPPKGNSYYNLAHQYMAAKLNLLNGTSAGADVQAAMTQAEALFNSVTGTKLTTAQAKQATAGQPARQVQQRTAGHRSLLRVMNGTRRPTPASPW